MFLMRLIGTLAFVPSVVLGIICVLPVCGVVARSLQLTSREVRKEFKYDRDKLERNRQLRRRTYKREDFILHGAEGERYKITAQDFGAP